MDLHYNSEKSPTTMHFFVDADLDDSDVPNEIGGLDPIYDIRDSLIQFLTLPSLIPRISHKHRDPLIDFTKSIILTNSGQD